MAAVDPIEVSAKSTKNEILEAYQALLTHIGQTEADNNVQNIAIKAIEGASAVRYFGVVFEETKKHQPNARE